MKARYLLILPLAILCAGCARTTQVESARLLSSTDGLSAKLVLFYSYWSEGTDLTGKPLQSGNFSTSTALRDETVVGVQEASSGMKYTIDGEIVMQGDQIRDADGLVLESEGKEITSQPCLNLAEKVCFFDFHIKYNSNNPLTDAPVIGFGDYVLRVKNYDGSSKTMNLSIIVERSPN